MKVDSVENMTSITTVAELPLPLCAERREWQKKCTRIVEYVTQHMKIKFHLFDNGSIRLVEVQARVPLEHYAKLNVFTFKDLKYVIQELFAWSEADRKRILGLLDQQTYSGAAGAITYQGYDLVNLKTKESIPKSYIVYEDSIVKLLDGNFFDIVDDEERDASISTIGNEALAENAIARATNLNGEADEVHGFEPDGGALLPSISGGASFASAASTENAIARATNLNGYADEAHGFEPNDGAVMPPINNGKCIVATASAENADENRFDMRRPLREVVADGDVAIKAAKTAASTSNLLECDAASVQGIDANGTADDAQAKNERAAKMNAARTLVNGVEVNRAAWKLPKRSDELFAAAHAEINAGVERARKSNDSINNAKSLVPSQKMPSNVAMSGSGCGSVASNEGMVKAAVGVSPVKRLRYVPGRIYNVFIAFSANGPKLFWVQDIKIWPECAAMLRRLKNFKLRPFCYAPPIGSKCVWRKNDANVYRVVLVNLTADMCEVFSMDFGETKWIYFDNLFELPSEFEGIPRFAKAFCLARSKGHVADEHTNQLFKEIISGKVCNLEVLPSESPLLVQYCELVVNGLNVFDSIRAGKSKIIINPPVREKCYVTHVTTMNAFYVQFEKDIPQLLSVGGNLNCEENLGRIKSMSDFNKKSMIAAKYAEDELYYRAKILKKITNVMYKVFYIDYGNTECCTDFRTINKALSEIKPLAARFALEKPLDRRWSQAATGAFAKLAAQGQTQFEVEMIMRSPTHNVGRFFLDGENVMTLLQPYLEQN